MLLELTLRTRETIDISFPLSIINPTMADMVDPLMAAAVVHHSTFRSPLHGSAEHDRFRQRATAAVHSALAHLHYMPVTETTIRALLLLSFAPGDEMPGGKRADMLADHPDPFGAAACAYTLLGQTDLPEAASRSHGYAWDQPWMAPLVDKVLLVSASAS